MKTSPSTPRTRPSLLADERGVMYVEYLTIAIMVTILAAAAIVSLGVPMLRMFDWGHSWVVLPFP